jgi:4'-phosphopantetheinyl transferase EntD
MRLNGLFVDIPNVIVRISEIRSCQGELSADEYVAIQRAAEKRKREFVAGRNVARHLLRELGLEVKSLPMGKDKCPSWPSSAVGSISHTNESVAVAVTRKEEFSSIGLDIETQLSVGEDLHSTILTENERRRVDLKLNPELATLAFCCKESFYKAAFPIASKFIEFHDVEVDFHDGRFEVNWLVDGPFRKVVMAGSGFFEMDSDLVKALYLIR